MKPLCVLSILLFLTLPLQMMAQLPNVGMLANINPNSGSGSPSNMTKLGSIIILRANNGSSGSEIFKTDGTAAGTVLVKDINIGSGNSSPNNFVVMGSHVYFTANDGVNGGALWRTDGTTAGTTLVKDINAGSTSSNSFITHLVAIGSRLYFRGDDGVNGIEPWISDGTPAGTVMLRNIAAGNLSSANGNDSEFVEFNGFVYFNANDQVGNSQNNELWRTDGTTAGTVLFRDNYTFGGGHPNNLVNAGSYLFFTSDNQSTTGFEPWKTDGTAGGTTMIKDIFTTANVGSISGIVPTAYMNGYVYFVAVDTYVPGNFNLNPPQSGYVNAELWRTDGTNAGTTKVKEINPATAGLDENVSSYPSGFYVYNNKLYFTANDGTNGREPWVSDGTSAGTFMLKNIDPAGNSNPFGFTALNGYVYFSADDNSTNGTELWRTDGTVAGTVLVKDINPGSTNSSPSNFEALDANHLLFTATNASVGSELYILGGYKVAVTTSANGHVTPGGTGTTGSTFDVGVKSGGGITMNFNPDAGNSIQSVLVNGSSIGTPASHTFSNVTSNQTLNVTFGVGAPTNYTITASAGAGGTISPNGAVMVASGGNQAFTITPNGGFCIQSVTVDGMNQGAIANFTFTNVTAPHTISATFTAATTYYRDMDGDGFGNPSVTTPSCSGVPAGYVANNTDCNDNNSLERPGQNWYKDTDNDNYAQTGASIINQCSRPIGYKAASELTATTGDCNDNNAAINPAASEICDGIDNNCNSMTDEGVQTTYYRDMDMDGFGNPAVTQLACSAPVGYVANNTDCNDNNSLEKPGQVWYKDTDNDTYAETGATPLTQCLRPAGYKAAIELIATTGDCNDNNAAINPAASEICDGIDNNCNSMIDEGVQTTYYRDMDMDGFGNPAVTQLACSAPVGYVADNTDCNDNNPLEKPGQVWYKDTDNDNYAETGITSITQCLRPAGYKLASELTATTGDCNDNNAAINPAASEICDGIDNNCNSMIDEGVQTTYYRDMDMDGFGNPAVTQLACSAPVGYVADNTDCNDNNPLEKPGQVWYKDTDNDNYAETGITSITQCLRPAGYKLASELTATTGDCNDNNAAINPAASEICDGIDNNCNSMIDEGVQTTYYRDMDMDGFGNPAVTQLACSAPLGYVADNTDCNDNNPLEKPGQVWYKDTDNDNYAETGIASITQCLRPAGYKVASELTATTGDCNDNNAAINPAASEICDGIDNNCNNQTDTADPTYVDNIAPTISCAANASFSFNGETSVQMSTMNSPVDLQIVANDNCTIQNITFSPGSINSSQVGQTVPIQTTVTDGKGNQASCTTNVVIGGLPAGWSQNPDGVGCDEGNNIEFNTNTAVWTATSTNCYYGSPFNSDASAFAQHTLCGDGSITALVTDISGTALGWAGVVMRETNDPGAKKAQLTTNLNNFSRREFRTTTNGAAPPTQFSSIGRNWLRIVRQGNQFTLYNSPNGATWFVLGAQNIPMGTCIVIGLVASNYNQNSSVTATFSNVSFTGNNATMGLPGNNNSVPGALEIVEFEAYPNPTTGELNIDLNQYSSRQVKIELYDFQGQLLRFTELDEVHQSLQKMDLSSFSSGIYLVRVKSEGFQDVTRRVLLTKN